MARAIWTGSITFGLVSAPVRLYAAIDEHDLELHLVHTTDGSRIGYQKICKKEGKPVPDDEIAKGYELDGEIVLLDDEDFAAAEGEGSKTIEVVAFVPHEQIDPIYFERTYYAGPAEGADKVYRLLAEAMERAGLSAIVRFFFRDRDQLACLRVREGVLLVEKMYYADEIRPLDDVRPGGRAKVDARELELALDLVGRFSGDFEPERYADTYRDRLAEVVRQKSRGETISAPRVEEPAAPPDLLTALQESLARVTEGNGRGSREGRPESGAGLGELSVKELSARARKLGVEGRSKMSKRELVAAIENAER